MKKRLFNIALLGTLCTAGLHAQETKQFTEANKAFLAPDSKVIMIASHRGVHNDLPENSMPAFKKGIELGIDIIEIDVRHTKDDSLVIIHDKTVDRTTDGKGAVEDLTFAEIRSLHLKFKGKLTSEIVPTLQEVLVMAKGKILVDLDIKTDRVAEILKVVERTNTGSTVFFFLGKGEYAKMVKEKNTGYRTLVRTHNEADVDALFAVTRTEAVHIDDSHYTVPVTEKIRKNGARIWINALDGADKKVAAGNMEAFGELLKNGANIIQTDYPALLLQYLKSKKLYYNQ